MKKKVLETTCTFIIIDLLAREQVLAASRFINFTFKAAPFLTFSCEGKNWIEIVENYFSFN